MAHWLRQQVSIKMSTNKSKVQKVWEQTRSIINFFYDSRLWILVNQEFRLLSDVCGDTFVLDLHHLSCPLGFTPHMENAPVETVLLFHPISGYHLKSTTHNHLTSVFIHGNEFGKEKKIHEGYNREQCLMACIRGSALSMHFSKLCATRHPTLSRVSWVESPMRIHAY